MADKVTVAIDIAAPAARVWAALTDPDLVRLYMMGTTLDTDWQVGHSVTWSGDYQGKHYVDKGTVKAVEPDRKLAVTHWSPLSGLADRPENYHLVTYTLAARDGETHVELTQENLTGMTPEQAGKIWQPVLEGLKRTVEAA